MKNDKIAYFDNAATTYPKPNCVYEDMDKYYRELGVNIGRGQYGLSSEAYALSEKTRKLLIKLFHAPNKDVIYTHTATEAINLVIRSIVKKGCNVYISPFEHNAVTRTLNYINSLYDINVIQLKVNKETLKYNISEIKDQFENKKPDVLIVSHASNVCGLVAPIEELCILAKQYDSLNMIDMCQTSGLIDTDLNSENIDYAIFDGHKTMYGPFGIAGIISSKLSQLKPLIFGGTGIDSANQNMPDSIPDKYEAGSQNLSAISGLYSSLNWIEKTGIDNIYRVEQINLNKLLSMLSEYYNIEIIGHTHNNFIGVVSCIFDGYSSDEIGNVFNKLNVAVRSGLHCAPFAHKFLETFPAGTVRFSVGYFTTDNDFDLLSNALTYIRNNS